MIDIIDEKEIIKLVPNYWNLSEDEKIQVKEQIYRKQLIKSSDEIQCIQVEKKMKNEDWD